jgi:N6-adenosine-specific RNA methylase IME4
LTTKRRAYATIVVDPPWKQPSGGPRPKTTWNAGVPSRLPYPTMSLEEIKALPVESLAAKDAHLYLWTTNFYLEDSYDVARSWGFQPSTVLVWAKTPRGLGMGGAFTVTTEYVLFCRRGSLAFRNKQDRNWWNWKRGQHSAKPEAFLDLVEAVSPGPYLELFARRNRMGWSAWGNEVISDVEMPA